MPDSEAPHPGGFMSHNRECHLEFAERGSHTVPLLYEALAVALGPAADRHGQDGLRRVCIRQTQERCQAACRLLSVRRGSTTDRTSARRS